MADREHIARLVVHGIPELTKNERRRLSDWLKRRAMEFEEDQYTPDKYSTKYTARLMKGVEYK